jgi:lipopolysaccharide biosynthesis protein
VAIHLPQFHPFPENDEWWGKGFTEWTNVTKAKPLFRGHYQPHVPTDLGFYDLRLEEARVAQAELARSYGIYGFCYYHYWFSGKRLMRRAIDPLIKSGKPNFPFMFCWANETWSRNWFDKEHAILIKQEYSTEDDELHAEYLSDVFGDSRYIRINNRPVFAIYRPNDLPHASRTLDVIRKACARKGIADPYFVATNSRKVKQTYLYDAILNFEPQLGMLKDAFKEGFLIRRVLRNTVKFHVFNGKFKIYDYEEVHKLMRSRPITENMFPCIFVGWDNTPRRREKGIIFQNQNVRTFGESLRFATQKVANRKNVDERIVFINAWNEWGEGNHLEPCHRFGTSFLEEVAKTLSLFNGHKANHFNNASAKNKMEVKEG